MITIVVGAQYGGEGKGKVCAYLAATQSFGISCRCGGPNSSHTVTWKGETIKLRMMPAAVVSNPSIDVFFPAGTLIHVPTLMQERQRTAHKGRLIVDPQAGVVSADIVAEQRRDIRYQDIGSTLTGTGLASALRAQRKLALARDERQLHPYLGDVARELWNAMDRTNILVEGHQGFGLSNYHGDYPYTSSRDSTASAMLSELGLGPLSRSKLRVVLAVKAFPTRNHAGALKEELSPNEALSLGIDERGGGAWGIADRQRRVGLFDTDLFLRAVIANAPSEVALTGADYLDRAVKDARARLESATVHDFIARLERLSTVRVRYVSTGPDTFAMYERKGSGKVLHRAMDASDTIGPDDLFSRH